MTTMTADRNLIRTLRPSLPVLLAGLLLAAAAGCNNNAVELNTTAEFDKALQITDKPVIVLFWKFGCASCMMLEPGFEKLATEYKGRIFAGRVMIMNLMFISPFPELQRKYEIGFVPVVILFENGQEKQLEKYHKALTALVGPPDKPGAESQSASRPASQPAGPDEADALIEAALKAADAASTQPATAPAPK
ncbi:MAG: thioredoxin domain-containing protein [Planctomycetota bacterium]|nr:thioredoxin domain-containing protein [Planctomycetota bacterium]